MKFGKNSPLLFLCCIFFIILGVNLLRPNLLEGHSDLSGVSQFEAECKNRGGEWEGPQCSLGRSINVPSHDELDMERGAPEEPPTKFKPPAPESFYGGKGVRLSPANSF